jgi:hypothetical protein
MLLKNTPWKNLMGKINVVINQVIIQSIKIDLKTRF